MIPYSLTIDTSYRSAVYSLLGVILFLPVFCSQAQTVDSSLLTLDRIFDSREFTAEGFGSSGWIDEGAGYTTLEPSAELEGGQEIVRYASADGSREVLVSAAQLIPEGGSDPLAIAGYTWSPDRQKLLIFTNTRRVWRDHTRGDYWILDLPASQLNQLGADLPASSLMFAKFSPQSDRVAYVSQHNLFVESLSRAGMIQLTEDGTEDIINGTFDWAYEEEFFAQDGFRWSPDGQQIAYWQLDATDIRDFLMLNTTDSIYSYTIPVQYPKVGQDNSSARVGVVAASGGETIWMKVPGDPKNNYLPRMLWSPGSEGVYLQHLNRKQNTNRVLFADAHSGDVSTVYTDQDEAWIDVVDDWQWVNSGRQFTWVSQKNGWQQVFLIDPKEGSEQNITPSEMDVISVVQVDEPGGWLYYTASPDNATQRYLYRSKLDGHGDAERLTPVEQPGTHQYNISPNAKWAIHTYSSAGVPPVIDLVQLAGHTSARVLVDNARLQQRVASLKKTPLEFFQVTTEEGVTMDAFMMKPYDFDSLQQYPVLFYVYGEPWGQTVVDQWGGANYLWHLMLAQQGYIVMSMDNRGTPSPKGREWRKSVYGKIGILASEDQAGGLQQIEARYGFVDSNRIGIWGWSGGGSMTLNMLFRYPELYHLGMSVAPVANQLLYDNIYQERYMGLPGENAEGYRQGSPITYAKNLQGELLIVHGTGDDNVHYQNTEVLINELVRQNKQFSMMAYPNRSHGINEGANTSYHLRQLLTNFLYDNLPVDTDSPPVKLESAGQTNK